MNNTERREHYLKNRERILLYTKNYKIKNRKKVNKQALEYYYRTKLKNPERLIKNRKAYRLKTGLTMRLKEYGLSLENYNLLLEKQNSLCAICYKVFDVALDIDHCHKTLKVRGLLCKSCNVGLGYFKDNQETLLNAAKYLKENS